MQKALEMRQLRACGNWARYAAEMLAGVPIHLRHGGQAALARRIAEQCVLLARRGITATDYYKYGLDSRAVPWDAKCEYLGVMDHWRWIQAFNPYSYRSLTQDKLVFSRFLAQAGLPVAPLLGHFGPAGRAETGQPLTCVAELFQWLESERIEEVVFKLTRGNRGRGLVALGERLGTATWRGVGEERISAESLAARLNAGMTPAGYLIERRLRPHPTLARFAPGVLHTARIVTVMDERGQVEIVGAVLRIGTGMSAVDNFSQGNIAARIDPATGRLGSGLQKISGVVRTTVAHPASGLPIEGTIVPGWDHAVDLVRRAARAVPMNACLGWDLGFTPAGPVFVEANDMWDLESPQVTDGYGLLATCLGRHLEHRDAMRLVGLGFDCEAPKTLSAYAKQRGASTTAPATTAAALPVLDEHSVPAESVLTGHP